MARNDLDFFDSLLAEMSTSIRSTEKMGIVEFAEDIIFNGDGDKLYPTQRAILKSFYHEPLNKEELVILDQWKSEDRTTWVENRQYIALILEAGRRGSKCNWEGSYIPTTIGEITYGELHERLSKGERIGIKTYDLNQKVVREYITYDIKTELNAVEPVYKVTSLSGKVEYTNKHHPYLTIDSKIHDRKQTPKWQKIHDVQSGEHIAISLELELFGQHKADNSLINNTVLQICSKKSRDKIYSTPFTKESLLKLFPEFKHSFTVYSPSKIKVKPKLQKLLDKEIHPLIRKADRESSVELLKRLYENVGNISILEVNDGCIVLNIKQHHEFVCQLLTRLGIDNVYHPSHKIIKITSLAGIMKFAEVIDLCEQDRVDMGRLLLTTSAVETVNSQSPGNHITTAFSSGRTHRKISLRRRVEPVAFKKNKEQWFDTCVNSVGWDAIKSIDYVGNRQTIALEVADTHVIGSYIITHNSTLASIICLKEFYDLITLESPQKTWGLLPASPMAILVMAQSKDQVKETIFAAIKGYAENSSYFKGLNDAGFIEILAESIKCPSKNIAIYAKHSNSKSLVGYSIKCMLLDEVARFETTGEDGRNKAFEIWRNVAAGGAAFGKAFKKVAISSAWEPGDPIEKFYQDTKNDPLSLGFRLTTFQINLAIQKGVTATVVSDYTTDYIRARLEYEGVRYSKFNSFIDLENLQRAATGTTTIDAQPCKIDIESKAGTRHYAGVDIIRLAPLHDHSQLQFCHIDPALKKDSAGLAMAHAEQFGDVWKIVVDTLIKWEPHIDDKGLKRIVSYIDIEQKLDDIHEVRPLYRVTFDQWNSESFIQKLHTKGIDSQQVSCSREMQFTYYTLFRDLLAHEYIVFPKDCLWSNDAIIELSELVLKPNRQIIHPTAGKDLADAVVNVVYQVHQYMIRAGLNITMGLSPTIVQSQTLTGIAQANNKLDIGSARDKLYNIRRF